ncbi:hypothetical protein QN277_020021 [Acacia crassicarpa]|uniref:Glycosyltransferase n=1 Tax=Acacia crassicarpa TaxID=499986 RepID=A0AAE1KE99_9FABA|nr:hypothetical protein QN277_020021 [Acacia crassicarpa]
MTQQKKLETHQLHFVLIPFMAPGHILPMVDIATLLARQNLKVTILTTPLNAVRIRATIKSEIRSGSTGLHLQLFKFPNAEAGLPDGCESFDALPSTDLRFNFMKALFMLQKPLEQIFEKLNPAPTCVIYDPYLPSAASVAKKFGVPGITFDGTNCFRMLCDHNLRSSKVHEEDVASDENSSEQIIIVPGLPHKVEFKRSHLHLFFNITTKLNVEYREKVWEAEEEAYGVIVNSFEELESEYLKEYKKVTGKKVYCVGPVSLSIKDNMDKSQRGNNIDSNEEQQHNEYLKWLDSWPERSVIYVCFGTLNCVPPEQLMELGLGLEATKRPFILVLRGGYKRDEMEKILKEDGLEERVKGRGLIIRGWVPQVLILSHAAIGAFLTHCGWNSTLEGISRGVPLVTFPMFSDQFYNEKVIVDVMKIGVRLGAESSMNYGEEDGYGVKVKREKLKEVIEKVMVEEEEESETIRERAKKLAEKANKAMEKGGSSRLNMSVLIEDIMMQKQQDIGLN